MRPLAPPSLAPLPPPEGHAGDAHGRLCSPSVGTASLAALSMRDEQIVLCRRRGLGIPTIADTLGHPRRLVLDVLRDAEARELVPARRA